MADGVETSENSTWQCVFEAVLREILKEYEGTEDKVRDGMESGMRKMWEKPYMLELQTLRGPDAPAPSKEEAQRILFFPKLSDMRYYVMAFGRDTPEATARQERIYKFKLMSVFYTQHRKDGALMDRFMHLGGLESLAVLLAEDHEVIRAQVVELLLELISPFMSLQQAETSRQSHLHHQIFLCLRSRPFWRNLGQIIALPNEQFPKSHTNCLKILAGAIGWLRPQNGELPESGTSLNVQGCEDAIAAVIQGDGNALADPETRYLAQEMLSELKQIPVCRVDPLRGAELESARKALFAPKAESREDAAHAWQSLKKLGNESIKAGLIWPAEASYRVALEEGGTALPASEASLIESNRAMALLKGGYHLEAAAAAERALERDPRNAKAAYRRAQALLELPGAAAWEARAAKEAAEIAARLEPKDAKVAEMLQRATKRVEDLPPETAAAERPVESSKPAAEDEGAALESMD